MPADPLAFLDGPVKESAPGNDPLSFLPEYSKSPLRKPARHLAQAAKGALNLNPVVASYNLATTLGREGAYRSRERVTEQSKKDIKAIDEKRAKGEKLTRTEERLYDRTKQLAERKNEKAAGIDTESLINRGVKAATGVDLEPEDLGETITNVAASIINPKDALKTIRKIPQLLKKSPKEFLPSGLEKIRAIESKHPRLASITKERQIQTIEKLDKQAEALTKSAVEKHQPITKRIQEGFDFEGQFQRDFGRVADMAERANPQIDITPLSNLISDSAKKYRGIPNLHAEGKKVVGEIKAFGNRPPTSLKSLMKTYRSNNQKIKNIYETSRMTGKQQEYVDFLIDYNKKIADSFKGTLPKDSAWLKMFESTNQNFKNYKDAQKTLGNLKSVFGQNPTLQSVEKLAIDPKKQKYLEMSLGKQGADEVIQIGKDLRLSKEAIKGIPVKEWSKWDNLLPLSFFIPGIGKIPGTAFTVAKGYKFLKNFYGWMLTRPGRVKAYRAAQKSIINRDFDAYKKAAAALGRQFDKEED